MTGRDPLGGSPQPDGDSSLTDGEPLPTDQGGQSGWDRDQDLSIADEEVDSVLPNRGQPVTDDLGRLHPDTDPMSNDNR